MNKISYKVLGMIFAVFSIFISSSAFAKTGIVDGTIVAIETNGSIAIVHFSEPIPSPSSCADPDYNAFAFRIDDDLGKARLTILMTQWQSGARVRADGSSSCFSGFIGNNIHIAYLNWFNTYF